MNTAISTTELDREFELIISGKTEDETPDWLHAACSGMPESCYPPGSIKVVTLCGREMTMDMKNESPGPEYPHCPICYSFKFCPTCGLRFWW